MSQTAEHFSMGGHMAAMAAIDQPLAWEATLLIKPGIPVYMHVLYAYWKLTS